MTVTHTPRVSIIIPTFNAAGFIASALQSVLAQTCSDYEVIVVDDGSTDTTRQVVLALRGPVRYARQRNAGPSAARNNGIGMANGELICFLDADDSWMPTKLSAQLAFMDRHPDVGLVFSDEEEFDASGVQRDSLLSTSRFTSAFRSDSPIDDAFVKLLQENFIPTSMVMARRTCFERCGLFDISLKSAEDRDMWARIAAHFAIACLPEKLGRKRVVASSLSRDVETNLRSRIVLWNKARRLFPDLAPTAAIDRLLAATYRQLSLFLLGRQRTKEARSVALKSLKLSRDPYQLGLGMRVVLYTLIPRRLADVLSRTKRRWASLAT